jgi:hypothetical protein
VLVAKYGSHILHQIDWSNLDIPSSASNWWKNIISLDKEVAGKNWIVDSVRRRVGNGVTTSFWSSNWIGNDPLRVTFPRLYSLSNQKEGKVADFLVDQGGSKVWTFVWRRNLFQWEYELVSNLLNLLEPVVLSTVEDCWCWVPEPEKGFSVNSAYKLLSENLLIEGELDGDLERVLDDIWSSSAPSKVIAFSWQLLYDRIPTRSNLDVRGIIGPELPWECVGCVGKIESSIHLFLHCPSVMKVWQEIFKWLSVEIVIPPSLTILFDVLKASARNRKIRKGFVMIWHASLWAIWKARNGAIFANGVFAPLEIVDSIKVMSWKWSMSRLKLPPCLFYEWTWDPGDCLLR